MKTRVLGLLAAAFVVALIAGVSALADDKPGTHEGTVVKVDKDRLTMADKDGKNEHSHTVPKDAKVTRDGKDAKLSDLMKGDSVKVTIEKKGDKTAVTKIEAKKK